MYPLSKTLGANVTGKKPTSPSRNKHSAGSSGTSRWAVPWKQEHPGTPYQDLGVRPPVGRCNLVRQPGCHGLGGPQAELRHGLSHEAHPVQEALGSIVVVLEKAISLKGKRRLPSCSDEGSQRKERAHGCAVHSSWPYYSLPQSPWQRVIGTDQESLWPLDNMTSTSHFFIYSIQSDHKTWFNPRLTLPRSRDI